MNLELLHMLQVSDSAFPIGAFTLSNGLETFVQDDKLTNVKDLEIYIKNTVALLPYNELGFFAKGFHDDVNINNIIHLDNLYSAYKAAQEIRKGSIKLCQRFLKVWEKIELLPSLAMYKDLILQNKCAGHHALALAFFVKDKKIDYVTGASIYTYSIIAGIINNAVKSVPLSQLHGQMVLNNSMQYIEELVEKAKNISEHELGIGGVAFDIYAMRHETLYLRLYMS